MKAAVISINIGAYLVFWKKFYETAEINFLPECCKEYFVFTDSGQAVYFNHENVHIIKQEDMGWPFNTMKRFHMFCRIEKELRKFDYIFFANANCEFIQPFMNEFLIKGKKLITVEHPGMHNVKKKKLPYERRKESRACVLTQDSGIYVQGAFFGGTSDAFLKMAYELNKLTEEDLEEGIIAQWHDESFLNMYINQRKDVQILGWQYLKYEEYVVPYKPVMVLRDKRRYLTNKNGRFLNQNYMKIRVLQFLRNLKWQALIKIHYYKWQETIDKTGRYIGLDITAEGENRRD